MENLEKYVEDLKESVNFINGAEIDEKIRKTIRRGLMAELASNTEMLEEEMRYERQGKPFSKAEIELLETELEGKTALSWDDERNTLDELSVKLRRKQKVVKTQAIKLGYQKAVDYWVNRKMSEI